MKIMLLLKNLLLSLLLALGLPSCEADDDNYCYPYPDTALGSLVNASPNSGDLYFFADENPINQNGMSYTNADGYYGFYTGTRTFSVRNYQGDLLATMEMGLADGEQFSLFAANTYDNLELLAYADDMYYPGPGESRVRFINLCADAPAIDIKGGGQVYAQDLSFSQATPFLEVSSGFLGFSFSDSETAEVIFETITELLPGRSYTVYTKGLVSPPAASNDTFSSQVLQHN